MASPLDIINETLDLVSGQLRDLGVEVSPFASQVFMLVLIVVILTAMRKKFLPLSNLGGKGAAMRRRPPDRCSQPVYNLLKTLCISLCKEQHLHVGFGDTRPAGKSVRRIDRIC